MGRGALVLYRNTLENAEVAGDAGIPFEPEDLPAKLQFVLDMPEEQRAAFRRNAMERVRARYSWEAVTDAYEGLLTGLTRK
jgi:glycosyltransferase involved in cell wall biosynthesis